jgi:hypothetical protein
VNFEEKDKALWGELRSPQSQPTYCPYAAKFKQWADTLCGTVVEATRYDNARAAVALNQCKLLLVDRLFEWRASVPKSHRNYTGKGHICLLHVFDEAYRTLRTIELSLTPPLLFLPAPPPARLPRTLSIADVVSFGGGLPEAPDE